MRVRTLILGNSGSGKSTLARALWHDGRIPVLDLDTIVWEPKQIAVARAPSDVIADVDAFCTANESWIVEGCYAQCAQAALRYEPELILLDPGKEACLSHCRKRPWEPHKYASKAEQDAHLDFLLRWVADYYERDGGMSYAAHRALYEAYAGPKRVSP